MAGFPLFQLGQRLQRASGIGYLLERGSTVWRDDDRTAIGPTATAGVPDIRQCQRRAAADRDFLQLPSGKETQPLPVWRKERSVGALGSGEGPRFQAIHWTHVDLPRAGMNGDVGDLCSVWRNGYGGIVQRGKSVARRQIYHRARYSSGGSRRRRLQIPNG